jgi:hypothetical protein
MTENFNHSPNNSYPVEYQAFKNARARCTNPNFTLYKYWGGRGIEFRFATFKEFFDVIGPKPTPQHTLDRIDNDGHYEAGNVRWATMKEQAVSRRLRGPHSPETRARISKTLTGRFLPVPHRRAITNGLLKRNAEKRAA